MDSHMIEWEMLHDEVLSLHKQGRYDRAVVIAQMALQVAESAIQPDLPTVATSLNSLGSLYATQGQNARAESLYEQALLIRKTFLGSDHPDVAQSLAGR